MRGARIRWGLRRQHWGGQGLKERQAKRLQPRYSQAVSHPSTNPSRPCLASKIRRDRVPSGWYDHRRRSGYHQAPKSPALPPLCSDLPVGPASHTSTGLALYLSHKTRNRLWLAGVSSPVTGLCHPAPHTATLASTCQAQPVARRASGTPERGCPGMRHAGAWGWGVGRGRSQHSPPWAYTGLPRLAAPNPSCSLLRTTWPQGVWLWGLPLPTAHGPLSFLRA